MANKNKNELLTNNSDLNFSEFDKQLSYDALQGIVSAKRNYNKAKAENDSLGMAKANAYANSIRKVNGGYTGGDDGSAYYPASSYKKTERPEYENNYSDEIDRIYEAISDRDDFSYDADSDPVFALYKKVYEQAGDLAYERALASNAARTGGMANTNAISAASQAKAYYNSLLAQKAADMYNDAYEKYNDETESLYNQLDMLRSLEHDDYEKYLGDTEAFEKDRAFDYNIYIDSEKALMDEIRYVVENDYQKSRDDIADAKWQTELDYQKQRDYADDFKWQSEMDYKRERDAAEDSKWHMENITDNYGVLAKLFNSVYGKDGTVMDIQTLMTMLGIAH